jgi:hypothetical protein
MSEEKKDYEIHCHANNAFPVLKIDGSITVAPHGKVSAFNSSGVETVIYENTTDREQTILPDSGKVVVFAA